MYDGDLTAPIAVGHIIPREETHKITDCARCGNNHWGIVYKKLANPVIIGNIVMTHWALCPELGEPILMYFVDDAVLDR